MAFTGQQSTDQILLDAELALWTNTFSYMKSMALKCALDLHLADAIHHHGGAATLTQIAARVTIHPSKIPCLRRLLRVLTVSGVFGVQSPAASSDDGAGAGAEPLHALTPVSRLLVGSENSVPLMASALSPILVTTFLNMGTWFQHALPDPCIFKETHGEALWEMAEHDTMFDAMLNNAMVSDSRFLMDIAIKECGQVFQGISSLIDVAGGLGAASQAILKAFPHVECSVMDLGHVVAKAPTCTGVKYIAGDMFESVPPADAVLLKSVMHDWGDQECVKILKNCKKAIPSREDGGKVIIIDIVVGAGDVKQREMHALFDLHIMFVNGMERDEQEWKKIFMEAGFSGYKIMPVLGFRSLIEVYP